jgi:hypothetical protein
MYSRLVIQTRVTSGEAEEILRKLVRPKLSFFQELDIPVDSGPPFVGWVEGNRFKFVRAITGRNSFLPIISGRLVAGEGGAVVQATLRLAHSVALFMAFWMTAVIYGAIEGLPRAWEKSDVMGMVFPLGMPIFGLVLTLSGFLPEKRKARRLLSKAFGIQDP